MRPRKPTSWFKREAAIMVVIFVAPIAIGLVISLFGPMLLRLAR